MIACVDVGTAELHCSVGIGLSVVCSRMKFSAIATGPDVYLAEGLPNATLFEIMPCSSPCIVLN